MKQGGSVNERKRKRRDGGDDDGKIKTEKERRGS